MVKIKFEVSRSEVVERTVKCSLVMTINVREDRVRTDTQSSRGSGDDPNERVAYAHDIARGMALCVASKDGRYMWDEHAQKLLDVGWVTLDVTDELGQSQDTEHVSGPFEYDGGEVNTWREGHYMVNSATKIDVRQ
jgi:hypothetical protein